MVTTRGKQVIYKESASTGRKRSTQAKLKEEPPSKKRKSVTSSSSTKSPSNTTEFDANGSQLIGKVSKRKQGRLAGVMNMPIDIFAETCSHLHPLDLLHLAWASKAIRRVLMSETSKPIWKTARKNQVPDLPECPNVLTEPQYTALVFTTICQGCGCSKASRVFYGLYARYCSRCVDDHIMKFNETEVSFSSSRNLLKFLGWEKFQWVIPSATAKEVGDPLVRSWSWTTREMMDNLAKEWSQLRTRDERPNFLLSRMEMVHKIEMHSISLFMWQSEQQAFKQEDERNIQQARSDSIKERLRQLGWLDTDFPKYRSSADQKKWYQLVEKKQVLTEKVWENLYPKLVPLLEVFRVENMNEERDQRVRARAMQLTKNYAQLRESQVKQRVDIFFPAFHYSSHNPIVCIPPIKELVNDKEPLTLERWNNIVPEVLDFLKLRTDDLEHRLTTWYLSSLEELCDQSSTSPELRSIAAKQISSKENFNLRDPTVVFECIICSEPLWYPTCFLHEHMIWYRSWQPEKFWDFEKLQYLNLCFNPVYISTISQLVACLGLDLNSTTSTNPPRPFPNPYSSNYDPEEKFVCRMCNNAEPMSMAKLIRHIFYENADYEICRQAIAQNGRAAFTRLGHKRDLPANLNDHCISSDHTAEMLWSQISTDEVAQFNNAKLARDNYMNQYRSQDYRSITQNYWVERKGLFSCSLCPKVSRLNSRVLGDMIFHVNGKHGVEILSILEERSMELAEANQEGTTH